MSGRWVGLSRGRRIVSDHCRFARKTPTGVLWRVINIAPLMEARSKAEWKAPWTALFLKAWALVAQDHPPLRRAYVKLPWPHLHEYPASVANLVVERQLDDEDVIFTLRLKGPESLSLREIAAKIDRARTAPVDSIRRFRVMLRFALLPLVLRRLLWWLGMNIGGQRAHHFGTFGVSVFGTEGTQVYVPISIWTTFMSYGPIAADGGVRIVVGFDHRAMDGAVISRAFSELERKLNGPIAAELEASGAEAR